jgi:SAM-dependent methyltransferase
MTTPDATMRAHYALGKEQSRLDDPKFVLEFERTKEIVLRALPPAPAVVADIGGGPGRYAVWLTGLGHHVEHRDITALHVEQARAAGVHARLADARRLDLADASVDAVLLLGPLYHLVEPADRIRALREARRVVCPGGPVFAAVISRWAARLDGAVVERAYERFPDMLDQLERIEGTGVLAPFGEAMFSGYTHRPQELADEIAEAGLDLEDLVGVEGMVLTGTELAERLADPIARNVLLDTARATERVPELLGLHPHLIATGRRPASS